MVQKIDIGKERLLMLAPTGVAAVNVDGSTIHSTLGILTDYSSAKCVSKLSNKRGSFLREKLSELKEFLHIFFNIFLRLPKEHLK